MANKAVAKVCPFCKSITWVSVPVEAYEAWQMGMGMGMGMCMCMCIQHAWPDGSATDRETLICGICPECQKEIFEDEQG